MKKFIMSLTMVGSVLLTGCNDGVTDREQYCLDNGGTWETCTAEGRAHARDMAKIESGYHDQGMANSGYQDEMYDDYDYDDVSYPPVEQGRQYTNYYGDPRYGSWDTTGHYRFYNPMSHQAMSTNSFLIGAGVGGLVGYMAGKSSMRSNWNHDNPRGYQEKSYTADKYYDKKGKSISKKEFMRRQDQSKKDRKAYTKKLKEKNKKLKNKLNKQKEAAKKAKKANKSKKGKKPSKKGKKVNKKNKHKSAKKSKKSSSKHKPTIKKPKKHGKKKSRSKKRH